MEKAATTTTTANECSNDESDLFKCHLTSPNVFCEGDHQSVCPYAFGLSGGKTLLFSLQKKVACGASFCVVPLGGNNDVEGQGTTASCTSLYMLTHCLENEEESLQETWELLSRTSSWGPFTCGCVVASSWDIPSNAENSISRQLRLAAFLGLSAVMVPLPECENDGNERDVVFTKAVVTLAEFLRQTQITRVWVRCDASRQEHRVTFSRLRTALLWGQSMPSLGEAADCVIRGVAHRVAPYLFFSEPFGTLPSEWLGEPVVSFQLPSSDKVVRAFQSSVVEDEHNSGVSGDILPLLDSYWATAHPAFLSLGSFMVELLRRRAMPVFSVDNFFETYPILNRLYRKYVLDNGRDAFANFEDVLQLPLQPLGHMLPSGSYEVFEQDTTKYTKYCEAMVQYFREWLTGRDERGHGRMLDHSLKGTRLGTKDVVYVVLLGSGRGPLIGECLAAASSVGVCVHLFAVEKNPEAMDVQRLRLRADPQWRYWIETYGHVVETLFADGRAVTATNVLLPKDWGLCDLVVSEMLGSFGDNELSPECIDDFYKDLQRYQVLNGIPPNPYLTSIPQEYTAWIAPLHSGWMEEAIAQHAVSGLTVLPPCCDDPRAALFHSMFVNNLCRGVALSLPQPCWTFRHFAAKEEVKERNSTLRFHMTSAGRCSGFIGYFSALLFAPTATSSGSSVESLTVPVTTISTAPQGRTPGMFSWFPCVFAIEPQDVMEVQTGDVLQLCLRRCVTNGEGGRVWYSYNATLMQHSEEDVKTKTAVINERGWAASMLLSS